MSRKIRLINLITKTLSRNCATTDKRIKKIRAANHQIIVDFLENGGWVSCGYASADQLYKNHIEEISYSRTWLSGEISLYYYELLLDLPLGHYAYQDLVGLRKRWTSSPLFHGHKKDHTTIVQGVACSLELAEQMRQRWQKIQTATGKDLPTPQEIFNACRSLKINTKTQPYRTSFDCYQDRIKRQEERIKQLELKNLNLQRELETWQEKYRELKDKKLGRTKVAASY